MKALSMLFTRRRLVMAAAIWFLLCLLLQAPATVAARLLRWQMPQLELVAVEGSFWRGRAGQAFWRMGDRHIALGRLDWTLSGWSLLWLHPSAHIKTEWGEQILSTDLRASPLGRITFTDLRAALPVDLLKLWAPVPARGSLMLAAERAALDRNGVHDIRGNGEWRSAQWQWGSRWVSLGSYQLDASTDADGVVSGVIKGTGDLAGSGKYRIDQKQRAYSVQAQLSASQGLPKEFRDSLVFLLGAKPGAPGKAGEPATLQIDRKGSFR